MKSNDKPIRSDGQPVGIDIEKRYEQNLDDIMKYIEQSSDSTHTNPKNIDKASNIIKNKKKKTKKDIMNGFIPESGPVNRIQVAENDTLMTVSEGLDKYNEKDINPNDEAIINIDLSSPMNEEEDKGEDEPKKKKRRRKNRKRGKKNADDDDMNDEDIE